MNIRKSIILIMAFMPFFTGCATASGPVSDGPFPIDVSRAGAEVDGNFKILHKGSYVIYLRFNYKGSDDLNRVIKFAGGGGGEKNSIEGYVEHPGVIIPLEITIFSGDGRLLYNKISNSGGFSIHGFEGDGNGFFARPIFGIMLDPGTYKLKIRIQNDKSMLSSVSCAIAVEKEFSPPF